MSRHRRIGGTDAPKLMGLSKYGGPIDVFARIVEGKENAIDPFTAKRGKLLEPVIRELGRDRYGWALKPHPGIILDREREWCASSPDDLLADEEAGIDYKSVDPRGGAAYGDEETDQVPFDVFVQCTHYMAALDRPRWYVVAYFGGNDLRRYFLERDLDVEAAWLEACERFWVDHVMPKRPPPPDASSSYLEWLMERRSPTGDSLEASSTAEEWARRLMRARVVMAEAEKAESEARNQLAAILGNAQRLTGDGWTFATQSRRSVAWKAAAESAGVPKEILEQHTSTSTFPVFREREKKS